MRIDPKTLNEAFKQLVGLDMAWTDTNCPTTEEKAWFEVIEHLKDNWESTMPTAIATLKNLPPQRRKQFRSVETLLTKWYARIKPKTTKGFSKK